MIYIYSIIYIYNEIKQNILQCGPPVDGCWVGGISRISLMELQMNYKYVTIWFICLILVNN
jgi:hypothetical protein